MNINNMCPSTIVNKFSDLDAAFLGNTMQKITLLSEIKQRVLKAANSDAGGDWRPRDSDRKTEKTMNTINYLSL